MSFSRESGILLHPTSLPGRYGIGEIGPQALVFVDTLNDMGQSLWQILPLGPTGYGDSPYQSLSTFAGNHLLISFDWLIEDNLLTSDILNKFPELPVDKVDFGRVITERMTILKLVCATFECKASNEQINAFESFCTKNAYWLDDYALFIALKNAHNGKPWYKWKSKLVKREPRALEKARNEYKILIKEVKILQYLFHDHWNRLTDYCQQKGVRIMGDIPIFVAHDSADVWAHPNLFYVDGCGNLIVQAGVPPDYFSKTGQLWGNPLYRWIAHHKSNYEWWVARMRKLFELVDIVRIDHFSGFELYWEVPPQEKTAKNGQWVEGPGNLIFEELKHQLGSIPIIAEDLGVNTSKVKALRDNNHFPGMRILQFAFGNDPKAEDFRPEHYPENCIVYTGTHDNDTTVGWFNSKADDSTRSLSEIQAEKQAIMQFFNTDGKNIHWDMIKAALNSNANTSITPLQDVMGLDSSARMNLPGCPNGNWQWRFSWDMLTPEMKKRMFELTVAAKRVR